jgi:hypothetical protein
VTKFNSKDVDNYLDRAEQIFIGTKHTEGLEDLINVVNELRLNAWTPKYGKIFDELKIKYEVMTGEVYGST